MFEDGLHPTAISLGDGGLVPLTVDVFVVLLPDAGDGVASSDGIDGEIAAALREDVGGGTDGAAVGVAVEHDDAPREDQQRVGLEVVLDEPRVGVRGHFRGQHVFLDAVHRRVEQAAGMIAGFLTDEVA